MARRQNRDRALAALAVLVLAGTIAGILIATHSGSGPRTTAPSRQPGPATPPTGNPPNASAPPSAGSAADLTTMQFQGVTLPVSRTSGPFHVDQDLASGFAETPFGAALAALHISVRMDASTGPKIYRPTISQQTLGDTGALLAVVDQRYSAAAAAAGVTGGGPVPASGPAGEFKGYRVDGYSVTAPTTVHLLVAQPGTSALYDVPATVQWAGSDWKLLPPPGGQPSPSSVDSSVGYTAF